MAVEYDLDHPLDLRQRWSFLRRPDFFMQHQCTPARLARIDEAVQEFLASEKLLRRLPAPLKPLQMRIYSTAERYRTEMHFSEARQGHFNSRVNLVVTHCNINKQILEEQLLLYGLSTSHLRVWQKYFIAETLPRLEEKNSGGYFFDAAKQSPVKLRYLMLSNHVPGGPERATMRQLAAFLTKHEKLKRFLKLLVAGSKFDDTGIEALEKLFPEGVKVIEREMTSDPKK